MTKLLDLTYSQVEQTCCDCNLTCQYDLFPSLVPHKFLIQTDMEEIQLAVGVVVRFRTDHQVLKYL